MNERSERSQPSEPSQRSERSQPSQPSQRSERSQPSQRSQRSQPSQPSQRSEPSERSERSERPGETTEMHTRLLKCALEIEDCRAYWARTGEAAQRAQTAQTAFAEYWFGARSMARIEVLLTNMRARFDAFPAALKTLHRWPHMAPDTRRVICHWHMQLADPLYRRFTGTYLVSRRAGPRAEVTRDLVVGWVGQQGPDRWTMPTRIQFASKLLSAAYSAGLVTTNRDPRPLAVPRVPGEALAYLMYLLREVRFEGTLLDNPYAGSVGLGSVGRDGTVVENRLEDRLHSLPGLDFKRQGDLIDFGWRHADLDAWAGANLTAENTAENTTADTAETIIDPQWAGAAR